MYFTIDNRLEDLGVPKVVHLEGLGVHRAKRLRTTALDDEQELYFS